MNDLRKTEVLLPYRSRYSKNDAMQQYFNDLEEKAEELRTAIKILQDYERTQN